MHFPRKVLVFWMGFVGGGGGDGRVPMLPVELKKRPILHVLSLRNGRVPCRLLEDLLHGRIEQ